MVYLGLAIAAYLLGSFPTGVVLSRRKYGIDVREMGSGNIGATNVTRVFGWYAGVIVFCADFFKGFLPLYALQKYLPEEIWLPTLVGALLVLGHCFSVYLKGRGGKGVATSFGCLAAVDPWMAFFSGVGYLAFLIGTRISAVGSLAGLVITWIYLAVTQPSRQVIVLVFAISVVVVIRHRSNIRRLLDSARTRAAKGKIGA